MKPPMHADSRGWIRRKSVSIRVHRRFLPAARYEAHSLSTATPTQRYSVIYSELVMTTELMRLEVRSRQQWRTWLEKHHASSPGVWLVFYKKHTGVKSIPYEDSVREALCFAWIDSIIKRLDDDRFVLKFTPR